MTTGEESKKRRPRGEGGVRWDERRQRFVAETTVGYDARGKRIVRVGSGKSQSEALRRMRKAVSAYEAGLVPAGRNHTVAQAVEDWLQHRKRLGIDKETWDKDESLSRTHIVEVIGGQKLQRLTVQQVDNWLADRAGALAMSSLREVRRCLRQSIRRAQINGLVQSNVVDLSEMPKKAKDGRPSKSLTYEQACGVLTKTTVGLTGFEPAASSSRTRRATKLRHSPTSCDLSWRHGRPVRRGPRCAAST
jgi:hypothetical protein